ncbi:hypothetical protein J6590_062819 [Homalodisca vitripennis]|nr:hypothetical protein J6590_062819 [Homalodisca vitripennis]
MFGLMAEQSGGCESRSGAEVIGRKDEEGVRETEIESSYSVRTFTLLSGQILVTSPRLTSPSQGRFRATLPGTSLPDSGEPLILSTIYKVSRSWPTDPGRVESDQGLYCDDVGAGLQPTSLPQLQPHTRKLKKFSHITFYHFTVRHHPHLIFTYSGDRPCIVPSSTDFPAQYFVVTDMNIYHSPISWVLSKEYSHLL